MSELSEKQENLARNQRQEYITQLFDLRGSLERDLHPRNNESMQKDAYRKMAELIIEHHKKIARSETTRLARERLQYKAGSLAYKRRVEASKRVDAETLDNLMKMMLHIVKDADPVILTQACKEQGGLGVTQISLDMEGGDIKQRISFARAEEYLYEWRQILKRHQQEGGSIEALFQAENEQQLESLKDKLYIQCGEDLTDTWEAFQVYSMDPTVLDKEDNQA